MPKEKRALEWKKNTVIIILSQSLFFSKQIQRKTFYFSRFFVMVMASEILFNQPFKNKIKVVHNKFYKFYLTKNLRKLKELKIHLLDLVFFNFK